ncbi:restriction endonuclease [Paenibacillus jamilae]|uniref:restriction endonuclease n=1 Tax=Paenibacillus TaxID=44249 RepID=UPI000E3CF724|nr:restriction endonuclease [Paenibacillus jamilae]RFT99004.1 restriction endonuclease [Paenibacillus jamilae]
MNTGTLAEITKNKKEIKMFKFKKNIKNDGKTFEGLVQYVYQSLLYIEGKDIKVERDVKVRGKSGSTHQIDAYYEFTLAGVKHRVAIECKNHKRPITKGNVQEFYGKLSDLDNCVGIMVSSSGFQEGAPLFAKQFNIELISLGELPLLAKVASAHISVMLPDEKVVGQPFWTIMENHDGNVTGTYITYSFEGENGILLFSSKKTAFDVSNDIGGVVRGVTQQLLKVLISLSKYQKKNFFYFLYDKQLIYKLTPQDLEEMYLIEYIEGDSSRGNIS